MTAILADPSEGAKWGNPADGTPSGTITYSFATHQIGNEPLAYTAALDPSYQADVRAALASWSAVAGVDFQEVRDSAASDIRIGWEHIDGPYDVVAETYYTYRGGQMARTWIGFDDSEAYQAIAGGHVLGDGITFQAIAEHEIGHAVGLAHNFAAPAIMDPVMSVNVLQPADIAGIDNIYGPALLAGGTAPASGERMLAAANPAQDDHLVALPPGASAEASHILGAIEQLAADRGVTLGQLVAELAALHGEHGAAADGEIANALGPFAGTLGASANEHLLTELARQHHGDWLFHT